MAQIEAEAHMHAMAKEAEREASMRSAAEERSADADVREHEVVQREDVETLKKKRQECGSSHQSASSLMTWASCLPEPTPQPPPGSALNYRQISPVVREEEKEEYIVDSCSEQRGDD